MPDLGTQRTKFSTLLKAIRTRLIDEEVFRQNQVFISLKMGIPVNPQGDRWAIVVPLSERSDERYAKGGGRANTVSDARFDVYVRNRVVLDQFMKDDIWLTDEDRGVLDKLHEVINVLQMWIPTASTGKALVEEPIRWMFSAEAKKNQYQEQIGLGERYAEFQMRFAMDLDQSWQ